ncbi:MAG: ribosomal protein S18-alanine N-acetyltransferase [bacterium]
MPVAQDSFRFLPLNTECLGQMAAIEEQVSPHPWSQDSLEQSILRDQGFVLTADDDSVAGFIIYSMVLDESELLNIAVSPEFQGRGLGRKLLMHYLQSIRGSIKIVYLDVRWNNYVAINLYERQGFNRCGMRKDYYRCRSGLTEDAIVMMLDLTCQEEGDSWLTGN